MTTAPDSAALSLAERLPQFFSSSFPSQAPFAAQDTAAPKAADLLQLGGGQEPDGLYEASLYRSSLVRQQVNFSLTQAQGSLASGDSGETASFSGQQLEFSFFKEVRTEELARFRQQSSQAAEGADGASRSRYLETSQRVAARFEVNLKISGAALQNFSDTGAALSDNKDLLDKLLSFTNKILDAADELFNSFFSSLAGEGAGPSIQDLFQKFQDTFFNDDFINSLQGLLGDGAAPAGGKAAGAAAVQLEFSFAASFSFSAEGVVQESDPIVLDLNNNGIELTSYRNGARFDILGNGSLQQTAFVTGGDAFLALDRNGDGIINSGAELFGDQRGAANGYEELRKLDTNGDGKISSADADYDKLLLFRDNGDGKTDKGELISLREAGIESISLGYSNANERAAGGNRLAQIGSFTRFDGTTGRAADAVLNYIA
ncbi:MAG: hypothetical protein GC168_10340 [Candidatus Hydrogenedens sp.]|nr:hypothetical protein [Candidatus Hydrogenedens sp.]